MFHKIIDQQYQPRRQQSEHLSSRSANQDNKLNIPNDKIINRLKLRTMKNGPNQSNFPLLISQ